MITEFDKALSAVVIGAVVIFLAHFGFKADATIQAAITTLVTAIVVYLVPNKK